MFFGVFFPLGMFILFIANLTMVILTAFSYSSYAKRALCKESSGIGVWKDIFITISYLGVIFNAVIMIFVSNGLMGFFGSVNPIRDIVTILVLEHFILGFKALYGGIVED